MGVELYRAVSFAELSDIRRTGKLNSIAGSCEGKHFATSVEDARRWGESIHGAGGFALSRISVEEQIAAGFMRWDRLDGIGAAFFATIDELESAVVHEVIE